MVDEPLVKRLVLLLFMLEQVDASVVNGPLCFVVPQHNFQCTPVVC
jgi:hypothetical protein